MSEEVLKENVSQQKSSNAEDQKGLQKSKSNKRYKLIINWVCLQFFLMQNIDNFREKTKQSTDTSDMRGKPKSGRVWKNTKTRFSSIVKTKGIRNSFKRKEALREELKRVKEASKLILATKQEEKELKKQRRRENLQRKEENKRKSEIVQVIKNTSKIKRMKKKQLRQIQKRDVTKVEK